MRPDAFGICLLKQTASGAQSVASPSKIEGFRELEADLPVLFRNRESCLIDMDEGYQQMGSNVYKEEQA